MPDFSHVSKGDNRSIRADTWNAVLDATRAHRGEADGEYGPSPTGAPSGVPSLQIQILHTTGGNLTVGAPARLGVEAYTIDLGFARSPIYEALKPTGGGSEVIVIAAEPILGYATGNEANGTGNGIGRAWVLGHAIGNVSVSNTSHRFAIAAANNTAHMISNANGGFPLLGEINATGNLTLGVLLDGRGNVTTTGGGGSNVALGTVYIPGNATANGTIYQQTLAANGSITNSTASPADYSYRVANYTFANDTRLLRFPIGDSAVVIPTQLANGATAGFMGNAPQALWGDKTFAFGSVTLGNGAVACNTIELRQNQAFSANIGTSGYGATTLYVTWGNMPTATAQLGAGNRGWWSFLPWSTAPILGTTLGNGVHIGTSANAGYIDLRGPGSFLAINGNTGVTGTNGGIITNAGLVTSLGNLPLLTNVTIASNVTGLSVVTTQPGNGSTLNHTLLLNHGSLDNALANATAPGWTGSREVTLATGDILYFENGRFAGHSPP